MEQRDTYTDSPLVAPVSARTRIRSIDTLRGVALFGILLLNIIAFAFPLAAYSDPQVDGSTEGINLATFMVIDIFFEGSMRVIFSMLFGAGLLIFVAKPATDPALIKRLFYRRTWILIGFGLFNAYILVWVGDILYAYGVAGLILYFFRNLSARKLVACSLLITAFLGVLHTGFHFNIRAQRVEVVAIESLPAGTALSQEQEATMEQWDQFLVGQLATPELIREEMEVKKSGYVDNFIGAAAINIFIQTTALVFNIFWDTLSMMLLGMAFMKWGWFDASRSLRFYSGAMLIGFGIGLPLNAWETISFVNSGFEPYWSAFNRPTYDIGRLSLALGYIGLVMMICKAGIFSAIRSALAAVGQMALTNYLGQSIICNLVFLGFGLGLVGELERYQLYYVVFAVWLSQLIFSVLWLRRYRFGPAEWLWRSLTYRVRQPLRL